MKTLNTQSAIGILAALLMGCSACSSDEPVTTRAPFTPIELDEGSRAVTADMTDFSLKLFKNVVNEASEDDNIMISPLSAFMTLSKVVNGADSEAKAEVAEAVGASSASLGDVNNLCRTLMESLPDIDQKSEMKIANSMWWNNRSQLPEEYAGLLTDFYSATVTAADFSNGTVVNDINSWCKENTGGHIDRIISALDPNNFAVWLDALYFKSEWTTRFDSQLTKEDVFNTTKGRQVKAMMMTADRMEMMHFGTDQFDAIALPYGNGAFCYVIVLPEKGLELSDISDELTGQLLERFKETAAIPIKATPYTGAIKMPKFMMDQDIDLIPAMKASGIRRIFDDSSFSPICSLSSKVGLMKQRVVMELDERGSEVAVATVAVGENTAAAPSQRIVVDHPFYYFIMERSTGALLVAGRMVKP